MLELTKSQKKQPKSRRFPRCLERSKEFCKSMNTIIPGVIVFLLACRVAYKIGVLVEQVRNEQKEENDFLEWVRDIRNEQERENSNEEEGSNEEEDSNEEE